MLDIQFIREHADEVKLAAKNKNIVIDIDELLSLDSKRRELIQKRDVLRQERNEIADLLADASKRTPGLQQKGKNLKDEIKTIERELEAIEKPFHEIMWRVPNIPSADTPVAPDENSNVEMKKVGEIPKFDFPIKDHMELAKINDWIEFDRGVKVHGFRGYFLKNNGAMLQMRLMTDIMGKLYAKGYVPVIPPTLVKEKVLWGTGMLPFGEGDSFEIGNVAEQEEGELLKERLMLAGTAEVGIGGLYMDEVLDEADLPLRFVGYSPCFRREVGSYGKDTRGIYRIHEFFKIEQFIICKNDYAESEKLHQELLANSEEILQGLNIPYRVIQICTGDMGAGKYKMFDIESWMPSRGKYGETHSCSNLGEWQARRLNIRYKTKSGEIQYVHTLNNTALASPRILIPLMELNQDKEGKINL